MLIFSALTEIILLSVAVELKVRIIACIINQTIITVEVVIISVVIIIILFAVIPFNSVF
jgi:hypothetical protein